MSAEHEQHGDGEALRRVMRVVPQCVVVVTADPGDEPRGVTVSSFISVSLVPPLVLISIGRSSQAHAAIEHAEGFAVNVLGEGQGALSDHFALSGLSSEDQFRNVALREGGPSRHPLVDGCLAYLDCRIVHTVVQADHSLFIGEVARGEVADAEGAPLVFHARRYRGVGPEVYQR